jgi:hypothetical protein
MQESIKSFESETVCKSTNVAADFEQIDPVTTYAKYTQIKALIATLSGAILERKDSMDKNELHNLMDKRKRLHNIAKQIKMGYDSTFGSYVKEITSVPCAERDNFCPIGDAPEPKTNKLSCANATNGVCIANGGALLLYKEYHDFGKSKQQENHNLDISDISSTENNSKNDYLNAIKSDVLSFLGNQ